MYGDHDRAAGWAFFYGLPDRAIEALSNVRGHGKDGKLTDKKNTIEQDVT